MTGELFDGWLPYLPSTQHYRAGRAAIAKASIAAGRDPSTVTSALYLTVNVNDDADRARAELAEYTQAYHRQPLTAVEKFQAIVYGSAAIFRTHLAAYVKAGAEHVIIRIGSLGEPHPADRAARRHPDARYALVTQPEACNGSGIPPH